MATQNCPRCGSSRVRRGYRPTPIWSKILFRYNLLCDACNWEFRGFAIPGTVSIKPPTKKRKKTRESSFKSDDETNSDQISGKAKAAAAGNDSDAVENEEKRDKPNINSSNQKRVRIKL